MEEKDKHLEDKMKEEMEKFEDDPEYRSEGYFLNISEQVLEQMAQRDINKADLAEKMNCSKPHITQLFRGTTNITLTTLAKMAIAVDAEWHFTLIPKSAELLRSVEEINGADKATEANNFRPIEDPQPNYNSEILTTGTKRQTATTPKDDTASLS